ncbi:MAG: hypothetical protein EOO77_39335 [Oxalobacteraceae bacterium]|nr:MAG: hypothetical protein EOO77_39335 [Oxalobacteraceae bacterium]
MRWRMIPVYADGKEREGRFAYILEMFDSTAMTEEAKYTRFHEAKRWCHAQFQADAWQSMSMHFEFINHVDAFAFKLRWG